MRPKSLVCKSFRFRALVAGVALSLASIPHASAFVDNDFDGMDDDWEIHFFLDLSKGASEDGDGDGLSNIREYLSGTNPNDNDTDNDGFSDALNYGLDGLWRFDDGLTSSPGVRGVKGNSITYWLAPSAGDALIALFEFSATDSVHGSSIGFDGANFGTIHLHKAADGSYPLSGATDWTVAAWIKITVGAPVNFLFGAPNTSQNPKLGAYYNNGTSLVIATDGVWHSTHIPAPEIAAGGWHHIAITRDLDAQEVRVFVNNKFAGAVFSTSIGTIPFQFSDESFMVGSFSWTDPSPGSEYYRGRLDDFRIYRRILAPSDLDEIYSVGLATGKPAVFWNLDYFAENPTEGIKDADGDGFSNFTEAAAGSDPQSAASVPAVLGGQFRLHSRLN